MCRIWRLELIISDFCTWDRYLYPFSRFRANNTLYELLRGCLRKRFRRNTSYLPPKSDSKTNYGLGGNFNTPNADCSKNTLHDIQVRCCEFGTIYWYTFLVWFGKDFLDFSGVLDYIFMTIIITILIIIIITIKNTLYQMIF